MSTFAVITPTIGDPSLAQCMESLRGQDCVHHIVIDGDEHMGKLLKIFAKINKLDELNYRVTTLGENVGKGWYGHRVYAASSFLVNEEVLCYLDEDNWVEPTYIESFKRILNKHQWAYTLRKVMSANGEFICDDNCESLGHWPVVGGGGRHHIDTGCFAVPRSLAVKVGHHWYGQWGADRQFFAALKAAAPSFGCTMAHTLNYRLGSETSLATQDMFLRGNQMASELYKGVYPWHQKENAQTPHLVYHTTPTLTK